MNCENENNPFEKEPNSFGLPEGYFQKSALSIANKIVWEEEHKNFKKLLELKNLNPFLVPGNYFSNKEESLEAIQYPALNALQRTNSFKTPENYFKENNDRLVKELKIAKQAKIIFMFSKRMRYAVAACFIVVLSIWIYNIYFVPAPVVDCGTIACLDKEDLVKTKNLEPMDDDELYELVDPVALEKRLNNPGSVPANKNYKDDSLKDSSDDNFLDDI